LLKRWQCIQEFKYPRYYAIQILKRFFGFFQEKAIRGSGYFSQAGEYRTITCHL
jgi:hypothetical protein